MANAAAIQRIVSRGYSADHAQQWLASHPGDEGRIDSAFPVQNKSASTSAPTVSAPTAAPTTTPAPAAAPASVGGLGAVTVGAAAPPATPTTPMPSMAGLTAATAPAYENDLVGGGLGGLRTLGRRMPPTDNMALAGLQRRVY